MKGPNENGHYSYVWKTANTATVAHGFVAFAVFILLSAIITVDKRAKHIEKQENKQGLLDHSHAGPCRWVN